MTQDPNGRITLHRHDRRVQVWVGDCGIADTQHAIELREAGYPPRQYLPREDVDMSRLTRTSTVTHCPFKGDASYYAIKLDGEMLRDAVWSYEAPFDTLAPIAGRLAFDTEVVNENIE